MAGHCETLGSTCDKTKYEQWDQYISIYLAKASPFMDCGLPSEPIDNMEGLISAFSREHSFKRCTVTGLRSLKQEESHTSYGISNGKNMESAMQIL